MVTGQENASILSSCINRIVGDASTICLGYDNIKDGGSSAARHAVSITLIALGAVLALSS